jgi:hypothetical protein
MVVDLAVPDVVTAFGESVRKLLEDSGGTAVCRRAEDEPALRAELGEALEELGLWDLDVRDDPIQALAAAECIRIAGTVALPYPIAGRLLARDSAWLCVTRAADSPVRVDHGDLNHDWLLAGLDGSGREATELRLGAGRSLAPFVAAGSTGASVEPPPDGDVARWLTLGTFWLLGAAERVLSMTVEHLLTRHQFGRPLADFQGLRLRIAECVTAVDGLRELCRFTVWHHVARAEDSLADALALRSVALEAVPAVFAAAHQLHGAGGFATAHDVTLLHRHAQAYLRLPVGYDELGRLLVQQVEATGFESLFGRFSGGRGGLGAGGTR